MYMFVNLLLNILVGVTHTISINVLSQPTHNLRTNLLDGN